MITEPDAFFASGCGRCARFATPDCSARLHGAGLAVVRALFLGAGFEEAVRWGQPCYRHAGRNVAILSATRDGIRIGLFEAGLLDDPQGLLEPSGPNAQGRDTIRTADAAEARTLAAALTALLEQARGHAEAGRRAPKASGDMVLPTEMTDALDADPALAEAFHALTPGRQRSYAILLASAKTAATRAARIARVRDRILAGKGATER